MHTTPYDSDRWPALSDLGRGKGNGAGTRGLAEAEPLQLFGGGARNVFSPSARGIVVYNFTKKWHQWHNVAQLTNRNVSQKYVASYMRLFVICAGTGRGSGRVSLPPTLGKCGVVECGWCLQTVRCQHEQSSCYPRFFSIHERHCQMSVEPHPPSLKVVPAPLGGRGGILGHGPCKGHRQCHIRSSGSPYKWARK